MTDEMSFEDFNKQIDESHDEGCACCFSYHHYRHLDIDARRVVYLGFVDDPLYYPSVVAELDKRANQPIDNTIYWFLSHIHPQDKIDSELAVRLMQITLTRAHEMIEKKMATAWVIVRAYAWIKGNDPLPFVGFLQETDDLDVWQVVFQQLGWDIPQRENFKSLSLSYMRKTIYESALKCIEMGDDVKPYVAAANGVLALAALQDDRAIELMKKLPRHNLDKKIKSDCESQIKYLANTNQSHFIPTLENLISLCQNKL